MRHKNRLNRVDRAGTTIYQCVYDAYGRPSKEIYGSGGGAVTKYLVWEGDELLFEVNSSGTITRRNIWGAGGYQGYYDSDGAHVTKIALRDGLGHVRGLMTTSKSITDRYVYDAYGNTIWSSGSSYNPFQWNGDYGYRRLYSGSTVINVLHVGARHYSPQLRRWLERDHLGILGGDPNSFSYAADNPIVYLDSNGYYLWMRFGDSSSKKPHIVVIMGDFTGYTDQSQTKRSEAQTRVNISAQEALVTDWARRHSGDYCVDVYKNENKDSAIRRLNERNVVGFVFMGHASKKTLLLTTDPKTPDQKRRIRPGNITESMRERLRFVILAGCNTCSTAWKKAMKGKGDSFFGTTKSQGWNRNRRLEDQVVGDGPEPPESKKK